MYGPRTKYTLLLIVILLAGCSGLGTESPRESTTNISHTDTSTPETNSTNPPPGISYDRGIDSRTLSQNHANQLKNTTFEVERDYTIWYQNGTILTDDVLSIEIGSNENAILYNNTVRGNIQQFLGTQKGTIVLYANETRVFRRITAGENSSYSTLYNQSGEPMRPRSIDLWRPAENGRIYYLFDNLSNSSLLHPEGGTYSIVSTSYSETELRVDNRLIRNISNFEFSATITHEGFIQEYQISFEGKLNGERVLVENTVRYSGVGTTEVITPDWVRTMNTSTN